jgi:Reverse transcriptase (RNA-dependent DNA polymerase)
VGPVIVTMPVDGAMHPTARTVHPVLSDLKSKLKCSRNFLNCFSLNSQSITNKLPELRAILDPSLFHVISFSETWLKSSQYNNSVALNGFRVFRRDRFRGRDRGVVGGGVALYVRDNIKAKLVKKSIDGAIIEFILVSLDLNGVSVLVGSVYSPDRRHFPEMEVFLAELSTISLDYDHLIVLGDFNIDLMNPEQNITRQYAELLLSLSISSFPAAPVVTRPASSACLDHVLTKFPEKISNLGIGFRRALSDHSFLTFSYNVKPPPPVDRFIFVRDVNRVDLDQLAEETNRLDWAALYATSDVDRQVILLSDYVKRLYEVCVPIRRKFVPDPRTPWMNLEIRDAIRARDRLNSSTPEFRVEKKRVASLIKNAEARIAERNFDPALPTRVLWSNFKRMGFTKSADFSAAGLVPDEFADYVSDIQTPPVSVPPTPDGEGDFSFRHISIDELLLAFNSITSHAVGIDGISIKFVKLILPYISFHIMHVLNHAITSSVFPSFWKLAIVRPVAKVGAPKELSDFRPISVLCVFAKIFERLLNDQILGHIEGNGLLSQFQSGFRRGHSTISALIKVTDDLGAARAAGRDAILVLLDFSKAFDCIPHDLLVHKLRANYGFSPSAARMIASFLGGRSMVVEADGVRSTPRPLLSGVPQGSILSPLLFSLFINDLSGSLRDSKFHFYADDLQIYLTGKRGNLAGLANRVNSELAVILDWSRKNGLLLNPRKSQAMLIINRNSPRNLPQILLGSEPVEWGSSVKDLGIYVDSRLNFSRHVSDICSKVYTTLHRLRLLKYLTPRHIRLKLCKSLILPFFYYGAEFCTNLREQDARRLEIAFNSCIRYVFNIRRFDHISGYRDSLLGLPFKSFLLLRLNTFFFKLIKSGCPSYLFSDLIRGSARTLNYVMPGGGHRKAVLASGVRSWNLLPSSIKESRSVSAFAGAVSNLLRAT